MATSANSGQGARLGAGRYIYTGGNYYRCWSRKALHSGTHLLTLPAFDYRLIHWTQGINSTSSPERHLVRNIQRSTHPFDSLTIFPPCLKPFTGTSLSYLFLEALDTLLIRNLCHYTLEPPPDPATVELSNTRSPATRRARTSYASVGYVEKSEGTWVRSISVRRLASWESF